MRVFWTVLSVCAFLVGLLYLLLPATPLFDILMPSGVTEPKNMDDNLRRLTSFFFGMCLWGLGGLFANIVWNLKNPYNGGNLTP